MENIKNLFQESQASS
jgi:hypothetical protein